MSSDGVPDPTIDLSGRTALVTGGSRNIGRSIALAFAKAGADVAVMARKDTQLLEGVVGEIQALGRKGHGVLADAGDWDSMVAALADVEAALGTCDILVNNAAIRPQMKLESVTAEDWDRVLNVNVRASFQCIQWALPHMRAAGWGRIINVSGQDAFSGSYGRIATTTSKGAVMGLTASVAPMCGPDGVTVNTLVPGMIDTHRHTPEWYPDHDNIKAQMVQRNVSGRLGRVEDVAGVALFLASDLSAFVTGQTVLCTGGYPLIRKPEMEEALGLRPS